MKHNLAWFDIPVNELERAMRFYEGVLGAPVVAENVAGIPLAWLPTPDGGRMGCLCKVAGFLPSANGVMIYFDVSGRLRAAVAAVRAHGGTVQSDVHSIGEYGYRSEVLDSEGNCIALHSPTDS